jgi:hypothetical protein
LRSLVRWRWWAATADGVRHYADSEGRASLARYAEMLATDRELRLAGYEVYRFVGHEITDRSRAVGIMGKFFDNSLATSDPAWDPDTRELRLARRNGAFASWIRDSTVADHS